MDPRNCIWILKFASTWIRIRALSQNYIINFKKCWHSIFYQFYLKNRYLIKNWYIKIMAQKESSELRWWIFVWPFNLSSLFLIVNQDGEFCQFLQPFILFLIVCIWIEIRNMDLDPQLCWLQIQFSPLCPRATRQILKKFAGQLTLGKNGIPHFFYSLNH